MSIGIIVDNTESPCRSFQLMF